MNAAEVQERLIAMIMDKVGVSRNEVLDCSDIERDLGCTGNDFFELTDAYAKEFNVDMSGFLWYFHTQEEGWNIGGSFFPAPYHRVERIPVSPAMLVDFASTGKWSIDYPPHGLPKTRWDIRVNGILLVGVLLWAVWALLRKC